LKNVTEYLLVKSEKELIQIIENVWVAKSNIQPSLAQEIEDTSSPLPLLDQLLERLGLLRNYNLNNRPAFEKFEHWWRALEASRIR
jgi:hypothetical protein